MRKYQANRELSKMDQISEFDATTIDRTTSVEHHSDNHIQPNDKQHFDSYANDTQVNKKVCQMSRLMPFC